MHDTVSDSHWNRLTWAPFTLELFRIRNVPDSGPVYTTANCPGFVTFISGFMKAFTLHLVNPYQSASLETRLLLNVSGKRTFCFFGFTGNYSGFVKTSVNASRSPETNGTNPKQFPLTSVSGALVSIMSSEKLEQTISDWKRPVVSE